MLHHSKMACLAVVIFVCAGLTWSWAIESDPEEKAFQGDWSVLKLESPGPIPPGEEIKKFKVTFKKNEMILDMGLGDEKVNMTFTLDSKKSPKWMDVYADADRFDEEKDEKKGDKNKKYKVQGIYTLEGDRLTICLAGPPSDKVADRPSEFVAKKLEGDKEQVIMVLERKK